MNVGVGATPAGRTPRSWVAWLALLLSAAAVVLGVFALLRSPASQGPTTAPTTTPHVAAPTQQANAAGGGDTCGVVVGAIEAMTRDRRPFLEAPPQWDDPITVAALTRAQASALVELEIMQAAVVPSTPTELAELITAYRSAVLDTLDADTRRLPAAISNAASKRASAAAEGITTICKGE